MTPDGDPRSNTRVLVITGLVAVAAGLAVAALLLFATGRTGSTPSGPFSLGAVTTLDAQVRKGGPVYYADPTGGEGLYLARADGRFVAFSVIVPGTEDCTVRWRASIDAYQDCHGRALPADRLATYPLRERNGLLLVDTSRASPPTTSTSALQLSGQDPSASTTLERTLSALRAARA